MESRSAFWFVSTQNWQRIKEVFQEAVELPVTDRAAFLDTAAGPNGELRAEIESLLSAHDEAGEFIAEPALVEAGLAPDDRTHEEASPAGTRIGPYEIIRELGRGGMAAVFLAGRADAQFEKQVAIKIIKRGMDTDSI